VEGRNIAAAEGRHTVVAGQHTVVVGQHTVVVVQHTVVVGQHTVVMGQHIIAVGHKLWGLLSACLVDGSSEHVLHPLQSVLKDGCCVLCFDYYGGWRRCTEGRGNSKDSGDAGLCNSAD
jgi:hypothetical protein